MRDRLGGIRVRGTSADCSPASFQLKDEKSVSRKHITLSVSNVKPGDGVSHLQNDSVRHTLTSIVSRTHEIRALN